MKVIHLKIAVYFLTCFFACTSLVLAADKRFSRPDLAASALTFESRLKAEANPANKSVAQWLRDADTAMTRKDPRAAAKAVAAAANVEPGNISVLLRLADVYGFIDAGDNFNERRDLQEKAKSAAFLAYQRATTATDEARSLAALGNILAMQELWRPAINALNASLSAREDGVVRNLFNTLYAQHGFRILDYQVDADGASPRVCFQFSEELPRKFDATPYVAVPTGLPGGVSVEAQQICLDGLKHGERYSLTLRQGLPSAIGESLLKNADYTFYVRDRTPSVRFTGRNYILPKRGQTGLPLVTVNLSEVALTIYRYGDRGLAPAVLGDEFLSALTGDGARRLAQESAQEIWKGTLSVENRLNEDITTAAPISEALGSTLKPGLYVMVARRPDVSTDEASYEPQSTQWFIISDLGIATAMNSDGLTASLRSLASAAPLADVTLRLIARNNEVLASARSDANGLAQFAPGLVNGEGGNAPGVLIAEKDGDYAFLNLQIAPFDLTDRGVAGRAAPGALDAYVLTERGVYRSGESVHVTALLRDSEAKAGPLLPIHLILERPDGVEAKRVLLDDGGAGGRVWRYDLPAGAMTGTYRLKAFSDPKRPAIGQTSFLVEDYVPDRLELTLTTPSSSTSRQAPARIDANGRWLFGAAASELTLEGETIVTADETPPAGLAGYQVGLLDEQVLTQRQPLADLPLTNRDGKASFALALPDLPPSVRPLKVEALIRLVETGGRGVERKLTLPITEMRPWIGVKPLFGEAIGEGETATFDVALLSPDGKLAAASDLKWQLSRLETRYQWFRADGRWSFDKVTSARRLANGTVATSIDRPGRIAAKVEWGRYRLDVLSATAGEAATSILFDAGISRSQSADAPDILEIDTDKSTYSAGETVKLRVNTRFEAEATLQIVGDKIFSSRLVKLERGANTIDLRADSAWGVGAYAVLTAIRPLDEGERRQPGRAMGVRWLALDTAERTLKVAIVAPALARPRQTMTLPVSLEGAQGEDAFVTVAAVDVGILNLTNYKAPDAHGYFFAQRRLGTEFRDVYGYLIDGMQGTRGRLRSGGDGGNEGLQASPPTQAPLAFFSGIVKVGADGKANVTLDIPAFAGTIRVMALAWSKSRLGQASSDIVVRDSIALTIAAPRFLAVGDRSRLLVDVTNIAGPAGDYRLTVETKGPARLATGNGPHLLTLEKGGRASMVMPITVQGIGTGEFQLSIQGPDNTSSQASLQLPLRPANPVIERRSVHTLSVNGKLEFGPQLLADVVPGTGSVNLSVSHYAVLNVAASLKALQDYPYSCTEQSIARALPLLYLSELPAAPELANSAEIIRASIERILGRQAANGSFGLWGAGGSDLWLDALAGDFLTRARERGIAVPATAYALMLDRLRNGVTNQGDKPDDGRAYALYVLARNGRPVIGDLRYIADTDAQKDLSALGKGQVAAALALLGDRGRAEPLFNKAVEALATAANHEPGRADFGSPMRDGAALVTLMDEGRLPSRHLLRIMAVVAKAHQNRIYATTQEHMWLTLAARAAREAGAPIALTLQGIAHQGQFARRFSPAELSAGPMTLVNRSTGPVPAVITVTGAPLTPEPATSQGLQVERTYFRLDGTKVDPKTLRQNERLVVTLRVIDPNPIFAHLLVTDPLPAGFEIDSPTLVDGAKLTGIAVADNAPTAAYKEFRDDRFIAAFDRNGDQGPEFLVSYIVRAVSPGRFAHPGANVEDMYHPERFARTAPGSVEVTTAP